VEPSYEEEDTCHMRRRIHTSLLISAVEPSKEARSRQPFIANLMFDVPLASIPAVDRC
jgi:hypothetical protein